ncbi:MAG: alpha/beta fold hydrolase [Propionibacteriaceae bacterium]|nr:alpha/beta fold hydrolase [Propionibacteriaceae bacterium]
MNLLTIGDQPPRYVFLHGLFGQGRNWTTIAKRLLPDSSLLVDLPDHGQSEWSDKFSYETQADRVSELLRSLDTPICLVGHSMGGRIAMMTALTHPENIERLVIEDTSAAQLPMAPFAKYAEAMAALPLDQLTDRRHARDLLKKTVHDERTLGFLLQNLQSGDDGWHWIINLELLRRDMELIGIWPDIRGSFEHPVLWITGTRSSRTSPEQFAHMKSLFPLLRQVKVKGAGHWVHADAPGPFVYSVREFAREGDNVT